MSENNTIKLTFGDPESIINSQITDYLGVFTDPHGLYYVPPISMSGLSKMRSANAHHGSCIVFRRNMLANAYVNNSFLTVGQFRAAATDFLTFGNAYLQKKLNIFGQVTGLRHVPALNVRKKKDGTFCMLRNDASYTSNIIDFKPGEIIQVKEYDTHQQIYGMPDWLGGLQSALLNQDATLFRRRYYNNGAHMGYIFYTNDPNLDPDTEAAIAEKMKQSKGVGNFRSMYLHIPNGKEKAVQILPIGDISTKDEYYNVKKISSADVFVAHRVPLALMGIQAENTGGFGDIDKIEPSYNRIEVAAMAQPWLDVNEELPGIKIKFKFNTDKEED